MNKLIFITGLTIKTIVELFFILLFVGTIGVLIFIGTYIINTIKTAVKQYNNEFKS